MSSSLMAKTTEFKSKGDDIEVDAISATEGGVHMAAEWFYLISPQTKMYYGRSGFSRLASPSPSSQAYIILSPAGIEKWANLIKENIW